MSIHIETIIVGRLTEKDVSRFLIEKPMMNNFEEAVNLIDLEEDVISR